MNPSLHIRSGVRGRPARLAGPAWSRAIFTVFVCTLGACAGTPSVSTSVATGSPLVSTSPVASTSPSPTPVPSVSSGGEIAGLFDVGGRSLSLGCRGTGSATVIFLAGTGVPRTAMRPIEDALLEDDLRVCDYDRASEGASDPAPSSQTDLEVVDDLAALLTAAKVPPPYVLVGQSVGGDQAWLYANRHPAGVAGFLIMNAGFFLLNWDALKDVMTDEEIADERSISEAGLGSVKQAASPPVGVPYVVMMSTNAQCETPGDVCYRIYPFYEAWAQSLAERTPNGRFVQVDAGHEIYQGPTIESVIVEIRRLVGEVP